MKKSLVLAMAMALGVTASTYAANPFSDVPAGHWAYDSISKLAAAGIIEGYGDDTFRGDRLMTRYEMAQIVAKALAKGANVDKLAAEFADELDALGVRVAALEKKSDNVRITGQVRYRWSEDSRTIVLNRRNVTHDLRTRLWFNGKINDNWKYVGMIQNVQDFRDYVGNEQGGNFTFQRAYVEGRLGGAQVTAGRHDFQLGDANLYDTRMDGIKVSYGDKVKVGAYYGKPADTGAIYTFNNNLPALYGRFYGANVGFDVNKLSLNLAYDKFDRARQAVGVGSNMKDNGVWSIGATYDFGKATLGAIYLKSNVDPQFNGRDISSKGFVVTGTYGGAESDKVGSFGFVAKYYNQGAGTFIMHTMDGRAMDFVDQGFKGYSLSGNVTVAKNIVATAQWFDIKGKETGRKEKTVWGDITMTF